MPQPRSGPASEDPALASTVEGNFAWSDADVEIGPGSRLGRYVIVRRIGQGGMGRVYSAYDDELERHVAIKILLREDESADGPTERERMLREAKALAKLKHPNVVPIYDVGVHAGRVWIAMEHVDGESLSRWIESPRPWTTILDAIVALGQGVEAVHGAGLIHRDIKPGNVMIGSDGRIRLVDFGIARFSEGTAASEQDERRRSANVAAATTMGWAGAGTPGYMPPEQQQGPDIGPAVDQFALCVTAWELLFGTRPWSGRTVHAVAAAMATEAPSTGSGNRPVPTLLRSVLERGLELEPDARYSSVAALLEELRRVKSRLARRRRGRLAGLVLVVAGAAVGVEQFSEWQTSRRCEAIGGEVLTDWHGSQRDEIESALLSTDLPYARDTAGLALPVLDDFVERWGGTRTQVCLESELGGHWDDEMVGRAEWCLDEARRQFLALTVVTLERPSAASAKFTSAVRMIHDPRRCLEPEHVARLQIPSTEIEEEVRAALDQLARVSSLSAVGRDFDAEQLARRIVTDSQRLGWPPLVSRASLTLARALEDTGDLADAEVAAENAYFSALVHDPGSAITLGAAATLTLVTGPRLRRWDDAARWVRAVEAATAVGRRGPAPIAQLETARGHIAEGRGEVHAALSHYERSLELWIEAEGEGHPNVAIAMANVANAHVALGQYAEAVSLLLDALSIVEASHGPQHPEVANVLQNLMHALLMSEQYEEARELGRRALAIRTAVYGADSEPVRRVLVNVADADSKTGRDEAALAAYEHIAKITELRYGPGHVETGEALGNLAVMLRKVGRNDEAIPRLRRSVEIHAQHLGDDHYEVAMARFNLGAGLQEAGRHDEAINQFEQALEISTATFGPNAHQLVPLLAALSESALAKGELVRALSYSERALQLAEHEGAATYFEGFAAFVTAQALWGLSAPGDPDRERALELAERGVESFRAPGTPPGTLEYVEAWLAKVRAE